MTTAVKTTTPGDWRKTLFSAKLALLIAGLGLLSACSPRVEVAVPQEPITINLNVKIEHEIQVKVDREIDELFDENSELF